MAAMNEEEAATAAEEVEGRIRRWGVICFVFVTVFLEGRMWGS